MNIIRLVILIESLAVLVYWIGDTAIDFISMDLSAGSTSARLMSAFLGLPHEIYTRLLFVIIIIFIGWLFIRLYSKLEKSEAARRESEAIYRELFHNTNDAILLISAGEDGPPEKFIEVNDSACRYLGYTKEELLTVGPLQIVPTDQHHVLIEVEKMMRSEGKALFEIAHAAKDGRRIPVEVDTHEIILRDRKCYLSVVRDISKRKAFEKALRLAQFSIDNAREALFWITQDGRFGFVNAAACDLLGYTKEELLSMTVHDIDPNFQKEAWTRHWDRLIHEGIIKFESVNRRKDGSEFPVEVSDNYVVFEGEEYNFAFVRDISERKEVEKALRESEERYRNIVESSPYGMHLYSL
ncbi:MAG TPA: PAS domain S-box protein, partial [Firmicutes bacterium]|nr:PAS domain S-box protein [Bacillota bacterium]